MPESTHQIDPAAGRCKVNVQNLHWISININRPIVQFLLFFLHIATKESNIYTSVLFFFRTPYAKAVCICIYK